MNNEELAEAIKDALEEEGLLAGSDDGMFDVGVETQEVITRVLTENIGFVEE